MSTHNIGFYADLTNIFNIFQLSSNIIKYAPYLFFCMLRDTMHNLDKNISLFTKPHHEKCQPATLRSLIIIFVVPCVDNLIHTANIPRHKPVPKAE